MKKQISGKTVLSLLLSILLLAAMLAPVTVYAAGSGSKLSYSAVYAVGNGDGNWLNGASWSPDASDNKMTKIEKDLWRIEFDDVTSGYACLLKFSVDGTWNVNFGAFSDDAEILPGDWYNAEFDGDNFEFTAFSANSTCYIVAYLDLRQYNASTKTGAKAAVYIDEDPVADGAASELTVSAVSDDFCLDVADQTAAVGDTLSIEFNVPVAYSINSTEFLIEYDTAKLEFTGLSTFDGGPMKVSFQDYGVRCVLSPSETNYSLTSGKNFVKVVFSALKTGSTTVKLKLVSLHGGNPFYKPGDINEDNKVNNKDLIRLFQYLSKWEVEVYYPALDVNNDNKVNNKDLVRLFQFLSKWDVEIY